LKNKEHEVSFDRVLHHGKAVPRMTRTTFHKLTGHSGDECISPTDECFGVELIGTKKKCVNCAMKKNSGKTTFPRKRKYDNETKRRKDHQTDLALDWFKQLELKKNYNGSNGCMVQELGTRK
jgi:hypothetical protein